MGYLDIQNLYKDKTILMFKECYAMEKIHGTSAHISFKQIPDDNSNDINKVTYFSGGEKHNNFVSLFDQEFIKNKFIELGRLNVTIYGEAYGGKCQGMSDTYGKTLKFIAFDVKVGDRWLSVPQAEEFVKMFNLEFVYYVKVSTDIDKLDALRDCASEQAFRNGCSDRNDPATFKDSEGIVLRPLFEFTRNNDSRIIAKHKREKFHERQSQPKVQDADKQKILDDAQAIADEWVNEMRLSHVIDHVKADNQKIELSSEDIPLIMKEMIADISKESKGEIIESKESKKAISKRTAELFKEYWQSQLRS